MAQENTLLKPDGKGIMQQLFESMHAQTADNVSMDSIRQVRLQVLPA